MQNYKLSVSKNGKKYTIVFKAETEKLARDRVHKEGYSILSIEENITKEKLGNAFLFSAYTKEGEIKHGKIIGDDIFKIYVKLRKNLEYNVKTLFSEEDKDLITEEKIKIIKDLEEEYSLFYKGKGKEKIDELRDKINKERDDKKKTYNFYLKKELDETYKLIDFVSLKLQNLLTNKGGIEINLEQKEKLKIVYNTIIKLKKTTNLSKLKEIGELALLKIGRIELNEVEKTQQEDVKKLLKQTNILLKKIGSKESFIEKNKDVGYIINNFFEGLNSYFLKFKQLKKKKEKIDKQSHSYIKNILFLKRYKEKLKENNIFIIKNIIVLLFSSEKRLDTFIRRKVIKQNITLFKAKEKGIGFSYTTVKNGFNKIINYTLDFLKNIKQYLFYVILVYTVIFISFININYYYYIGETSYQGLFYFLVIFFIYLILYFTRNLLLIILNFVILFFIVIFGVVNF
ncbi:MAG: hypothetical protein QM490_03860 [Candidatus Gracilibacteria bacterium]